MTVRVHIMSLIISLDLDQLSTMLTPNEMEEDGQGKKHINHDIYQWRIQLFALNLMKM